MTDTPKNPVTADDNNDNDDEVGTYTINERGLPIPVLIGLIVLGLVLIGYSYYTQLNGVEAGKDVVSSVDYVPTADIPLTPSTRAAEWVRGVSQLPESPERQAFIQYLGESLADGEFSEKEFKKLTADYARLNEHHY